MNELLSDLNVLYVKIHNYHYNVVGGDFFTVHEALESEYDQIHEWIDVVAELIKQKGEYPAASLEEYLNLTSIKEVSSKDYRSKEIITDVVSDYNSLIKKIEKLKDNEKSFVINSLEDIEDVLSKKVWLLNSMIK